MSHKPTAEQAAVVDGFLTGQNLVIEAGAGTGKTSTLKLLAAQAGRRRGVYIAYNRSIADDAARGFPSSVLCKTAHGLAYGAVGARYRHRLNAPRQRAQDTARILRINDPIQLDKDRAPLAPQQLARLTMETIARFCYSADEQVTRWHVPLVPGVDEPAQRAELARYLVPIAQRAWDEDLTRVDGQLRFTHDVYLKLWILSGPQLPADYVLLDEAQDSNPAVAALVQAQDAQQILVGDRSQAIYGWRGATDAMQSFKGQRYQLSQSFRFGPAIATEANKWLTVLNAPLRLRGFERISSTVGRLIDQHPDAVLCRSNAGAMSRAIEGLAQGRSVALVGGGQDIQRMARAALDLQAGRPTDHPELFPFRTWPEVEEYVSQGADGSDLKVFVGLVNRYGAAEVIRACDGLVDERYADLVVSTAHKAKGREWGSVRIATDFSEPKPNDEGEVRVPRDDAMLAYVAVTRAQRVLDREGLEWIDRLVPARPIDELIEASSLGTPQARMLRAEGRAHSAAQLTGMPQEQADWDADEEWPTPVPAPGGDDQDDEPTVPVPTVDLDAVYVDILERAPGGRGWLSLYCLSCGKRWEDCDEPVMPDRRWTTTGTVVDFAQLIHRRLDALRLAGAR